MGDHDDLTGPDGKLPHELEGFSPAFVADLRDMVAKYGAEVRGIEGLRRMNLPTPLACQATVTVPPSRMGNISLRPAPFDGDVSRLCILILDDAARSYVQWDRRVTVAEVKAAMAAVDAEMAHCRDPLTGARRRVVCDTFAPPQLSVDAVFAGGKVVRLSADVDPSVMRLQFDRPGEVVIERADGGAVLRRMTETELEARRDEVTARVLAKHGVRDDGDVEAMSRDRLQDMLAEIAAELEKP